MIAELKEVILKVEQLKEDKQREIAKLIEEEMKWDNALHNSGNKLSALAQEAISEHQAGNTQQTDW